MKTNQQKDSDMFLFLLLMKMETRSLRKPQKLTWIMSRRRTPSELHVDSRLQGTCKPNLKTLS